MAAPLPVPEVTNSTVDYISLMLVLWITHGHIHHTAGSFCMFLMLYFWSSNIYLYIIDIHKICIYVYTHIYMYLFNGPIFHIRYMYMKDWTINFFVSTYFSRIAAMLLLVTIAEMPESQPMDIQRCLKTWGSIWLAVTHSGLSLALLPLIDNTSKCLWVLPSHSLKSNTV